MVKLGHAVGCLVARATDEEFQDAAQSGVELFYHPGELVGLRSEQRLCLPGAVPASFDPTLLIGHGHVTGPIAAAMRAAYPKARRIHFFHTAPFGIEPHKDGGGGYYGAKAAAKEDLERQLGASAEIICAVGPRLSREWRNNLNGKFPGNRIYQIVPDMPSHKLVDPAPANECLILGRMDDWRLKGVDIAARAVALLSASNGEHGLRPRLVIRGVEQGAGAHLEAELRNLIGDLSVELRLKEYTADADTLLQDLRSAAVVLMPSREEGFGLVGLEALGAGVPVLVSDQSGLADLLVERKDGVGCVVAVTRNLDRDSPVWAEAVKRSLASKPDAFKEAREFADRYRAEKYMEKTVAAIFADLEERDGGPSTPPSNPPIPPTPVVPPVTSGASGPAPTDMMEEIAKLSPPAAMMASFAELETELGLARAPGANLDSAATLAKQLDDGGKIPRELAASIAELSAARNDATHGRAKPTAAEAMAFIGKTRSVRARLATSLERTPSRMQTPAADAFELELQRGSARVERALAKHASLISRPALVGRLRAELVQRGRLRLVGRRGVGKSTLAAELARGSPTIWIDASELSKTARDDDALSPDIIKRLDAVRGLLVVDGLEIATPLQLERLENLSGALTSAQIVATVRSASRALDVGVALSLKGAAERGVEPLEEDELAHLCELEGVALPPERSRHVLRSPFFFWLAHRIGDSSLATEREYLEAFWSARYVDVADSPCLARLAQNLFERRERQTTIPADLRAAVERLTISGFLSRDDRNEEVVRFAHDVFLDYAIARYVIQPLAPEERLISWLHDVDIVQLSWTLASVEFEAGRRFAADRPSFWRVACSLTDKAVLHDWLSAARGATPDELKDLFDLLLRDSRAFEVAQHLGVGA